MLTLCLPLVYSIQGPVYRLLPSKLKRSAPPLCGHALTEVSRAAFGDGPGISQSDQAALQINSHSEISLHFIGLSLKT